MQSEFKFPDRKITIFSKKWVRPKKRRHRLEESEANLACSLATVAEVRSELESVKSEFENIVYVIQPGGKYYTNNVYVVKIKQATTTSFDATGSEKNFGKHFWYYDAVF